MQPIITFQHSTADFGFRIDAGTVLNYSDPLHQRIVKTVVERIPGVAVTFGQAVPVTDAATFDQGIRVAETLRNSAADRIATIQKGREAEIERLEERLEDINHQVMDKVVFADGSDASARDAELQKFLESDQGRQITAPVGWIRQRILTVRALIAAGLDGSDSQMEMTEANIDLAKAKARIAELEQAKARVAELEAAEAARQAKLAELQANLGTETNVFSLAHLVDVLAGMTEAEVSEIPGLSAKTAPKVIAWAKESIAFRPTKPTA